MLNGFRLAAAIAIAGCGGPDRAAETAPPPCPSGDVRVADAAEVEALRACSSLAGDLAIDGAAIRDIEALARLQHIEGDLAVGPTLRLTSLGGLKNLRSVTGNIDVRSNQQLAGVFLGQLADVGGNLNVDRNPGAATVSLHRLERVGGNLEISGNSGMFRLDLSALRTVGGDALIEDNRQLEDLVIGEVQVAGERRIDPPRNHN